MSNTEAKTSKKILTSNFPELNEFPGNVNDYRSLYEFSINNREQFWSTIARKRIEWISEFNEVTTGEFDDPNFALKWFIGGKLNVSG